MAFDTAKSPPGSIEADESDTPLSQNVGPVRLTVLDSKSGALTKRYGPTENGDVEKTGNAAPMTAGTAWEKTAGFTVSDALQKLGGAIIKLKPTQAFMTGLPPDGREHWDIVTADDPRLSLDAGIIARTNVYFRPIEGPAFFPLDFDVKEYPAEIKARLAAAGGLEEVMRAVCPALGEAARLVSPSASSHIVNPATGKGTGAAGEHWYFVLTDGRATVEFAKRIAAHLEAAGWVWGHVTDAGTIILKTLIDTAASNPSRIWYEARPVLTGGLVASPAKAPRLFAGRVLRPDDLSQLTPAEDDARSAHRARAVDAKETEAAEVKAAREADLIEKRVASGEAPEAAARAVKSAVAGNLFGNFEVTFDDGTSATVREVLDNPAAFHRKTGPDPLEPEYGGGRNVAVVQTSHPPQIFSHAHGGLVYRLYRDEAERAKAERAKAERAPRPEDNFEVQPSPPTDASEPTDDQASKDTPARAQNWGEPFDIFGDARPAQLSSPPPGSLPDVLDRWSRSEARRKGVSQAFAAAAALAVVAGAIGNGLTFQPRRKDTDWRVPSALWISLVDQPGSGKSPVIAAALKPLNEIDAERRKTAAAQAKLEQAARAAEPKARKGPPVAKPVPRSLVDNTTMEKLVSMLAENPRGLLQKPDELASLFGALGAYKKSGEGDRGQLLRLYDGGSITVDRQGSGTTHAENALLSILSGTQPDRIGKVARDLGSDGMLQRFLFVLGDEVERGGGVDEEPDEVAGQEYHELVRYLATAESPGRVPVVLSDEAHTVLGAAEAKIRSLKNFPGVPGAWAEHVAKWNGTLYRITLAFHAVECWRAWSIVDGVFPEFYPQPVSGETARRAALFSGFMLRHALAFYQRFFEHGETGKDARRFAGFILTAPEKATYSRRDIGQAVRELRDRRHRDQVTRELEDIGWLRGAARDAEGVSKWEVNPAVHVRFAERAKWEIDERRAKRESIALATETRRNWLGTDGEA
ncbi:MAG: DUF3987 domain-containing protein [Tabrizicola sp.]|uniref:DUF3987 domain-containing protein n=1 Tax=Tabrizicola sp. TaxID=2005166 RepID=UPI002732DB06|nr:DUF3987 domain-containing protein [Tabrizicola sp.]MDP3262444.1 DUF3987 domain-containing protein [Tabrizicola sp.]MDP3648536.1 DUF3987 domain-containing protein [Paracoccaceae bacterium]MDZ4066768.1 DUF3987 domain-containing protein [Tabrizicola sp.]